MNTITLLWDSFLVPVRHLLASSISNTLRWSHYLRDRWRKSTVIFYFFSSVFVNSFKNLNEILRQKCGKGGWYWVYQGIIVVIFQQFCA